MNSAEGYLILAASGDSSIPVVGPNSFKTAVSHPVPHLRSSILGFSRLVALNASKIEISLCNAKGFIYSCLD